MLSNYSSFLELSAGVYASICFDDVLKNIWSSQYNRKIQQIFEKITVYSYTNLSEELQVQNKEWVSSLKRPMIKRAVLMLLVISFSLLFAGAEEELQKTDGLLSQIRTSLVLVGFFILIGCFMVLEKWVFRNWRNFILAFIGIFLIGSVFTSIIISKHIECPFCDKYFTPLFISFISIPAAWQIFVSWIYSSLYIGYVRDEIEHEIQEYTLAVDLLNKKDKSEMPNGYSDIYVDQVLKDINNANDTCVELFNNRLLDQIKNVSQPKGTFIILWSWIKFNYRKLRNKKNNVQRIHIKTIQSTPSKYSIPEQILQSSTVTLKLDYAEEHKLYKELKKNNKERGVKYGLKDFCKEHGCKYEEMKIWLDKQNTQNTNVKNVKFSK